MGIRARLQSRKSNRRRRRSHFNKNDSNYAGSEALSAEHVLSPKSDVTQQAVQRAMQDVKDRSFNSGDKIQSKLVVGEPNDKYEREADQVADHVTNNSNSIDSHKAKSEQIQQLNIQRDCKECREEPVQRQAEEEEVQTKLQVQKQEEAQPKLEVQKQEEEEAQPKLEVQKQEEEEAQPKLEVQKQEEEEAQPKLEVQKQEEEEAQPKLEVQKQEVEEVQPKLQVQKQAEEEEEPVQSKSTVNSQRSNTSKVESAIQATRGGGQPLSKSTRSHLEPKFGYDFSRVKVHNNVQSDELNRTLGARAFTVGKDIYFRHGEYNPETSKGKKLLAHELTHVVQQENKKLQRTQMIQRKCTNAAGTVGFIITSSGVSSGYTKIKQGGKIMFQNFDTKPHTIKIVPKGLFSSNSFTVAPGGKLYTRASKTTKEKSGSIYDGRAAHRTVHDVTVCP